MHKSNFFISFAIWLIILPLLGIPGDWKNILMFLSGILFLLVLLAPIMTKKLEDSPEGKGNNYKEGNLKFSSEDEIKKTEIDQKL
ncbi:MAG: hypothetical protein JW740_02135 [Candidatus Zambryskibacteria bacterium]|nr:hypothetical protein [Candidatus Zambryskibacteria bacterium]